MSLSIPSISLYGRKKGRIRKTKADLLLSHLPQIEIHLSSEGTLAWPFFEGKNPFFVEIGYGAGDHLIAQMKAHPEGFFLGCEPFLGGIASFLKKLIEASLPLSSVRLFTKDGQSILRALPDKSVSGFFLLFPDPWPKKKHHKRRFFQETTLKEIVRCLKKEGTLTFASDWGDYFQEMEDLSKKEKSLAFLKKGVLLDSENTDLRPLNWPVTQFEQKAHKAGRTCQFLILKKSN